MSITIGQGAGEGTGEGDRWGGQVGGGGGDSSIHPDNSLRRVHWTASGWWSVGEGVSFFCTAQ